MMCKLLILQLLAHLVSDFYLQTEKSCKSKADNAFKSRHLYIHALITFGCAWLFSLSVGFWWAALLIAALHLIIAQRAYESNSKAITTSDSMLEIANGLKR